MADDKLSAAFTHYEEFLSGQDELLAPDFAEQPSTEDDRVEEALLRRLCSTLDSYQEQSYLLDPYLETLVVPVVNKLKQYALVSVSAQTTSFSTTRVTRTSLLIYQYIKCRGHKTIIRFFPHEIADLSVVLNFMQKPGRFQSDVDQWALRYLFLLWLSLICMLPFDLAQFDEIEGNNHTAKAIDSVGKSYLHCAGLERHGAALVLSRLYMRKDTTDNLRNFMICSIKLTHESEELFSVIGCLQVLCEMLKSTPIVQARIILSHLSAIVDVLDHSSYVSNTMVRKFKTKLISRATLRMLPGKHDTDVDVPEEIEALLEQLFMTLQDRDTVVRWSAAKGVARIANALPSDFADQVLSTIMGLFAVHSMTAATIYDMPTLAESTWHGAALACAEIARRGLVRRELLAELVDWMSKALYFDLRKGAHSIGSNVRDAAAYVIWALARSKDTTELAPYAERLAYQLVNVALFDREIHIRRAASAAYQENVGRTNLFVHGIDVLRKTDFYAVSVRRNAFLVAAPQVAEHVEYRDSMLSHLLDVSLRHWDAAIRTLAAESTRLVCMKNMDGLAPRVLARAKQLLESPDNADIHGGLLVLTQLSIAYSETARSEGQRLRSMRNIFRQLSIVPHSVLVGPRNEIVTAATCELIAHTITLCEVDAPSVPEWRKILDYGLKHRSITVQEAAVEALGALSRLVDCGAILKSGSIASQQSLGRVLGAVDYEKYPGCLPEAVDCLLACVKAGPAGINTNLEARHSCFAAIPKVIENVAPHLAGRLEPTVFNALHDALIDGLDDYTNDERGDVGSWIRITCINGLARVAEILVSSSKELQEYGVYYPPGKHHKAVSGILKQGVERLDNVRHEAGECMSRLLRLGLPDTEGAAKWALPSIELLKELFLFEKEEEHDWAYGTWLFPRAVRLLNVEHYRKPILLGLLTSMGSRTDSINKPAASSLVAHVKSLPLERGDEDGRYNVVEYIDDVLKHAKANWSSNANVVPVLQALNVLLEGGALGTLDCNAGVSTLVSIHSLVCRHVDKIKNVPRIHESMKVVVNLLSFPSILDRCIDSLVLFLGHHFPKVRSETAEFLYLTLQSLDLEVDEVEEFLLESEWSSGDAKESEERAQYLVELFRSGK